MNIATEVLELLQLEFFWRAVIASTLAGLICGFVGPYLSWRNLGLLGASLSHAALTPISLAYMIGVSVKWLLLPFSLLISLIIAYLKEKNYNSLDSVLAIFYSGFMALGILFLSQLEFGSTEMVHLLFGDILTVSWSDVLFLLFVFVFILVFAIKFKKPLLLSLVHPELAKVEGKNMKYFTYACFAIIGLCVVASLKIIGLVLLTCLMMAPTLMATKRTKSLKAHFLFCSLAGALLAFVGILLSAVFNLPSGASIASLAMLVFFINLLLPATNKQS
ncbi:MAG: metal ABC transporter permease [Bdellovibrionales bacterium]|nr:metal ABC transporter permease [Bdellovibrionales bacterium]